MELLPPAEPAVRLRGVTKAFGAGDARVAVLRGADLDVRRGELLMLVGPSGCGKTTLISVLAGTLRPDAGEVQVLGNDLQALDERARVRFRADHVGFVFQAFNLIPTLTVAENVAVPLQIRGERPAAAVARATQMLERVGLGARAAAMPAQLSGGQQQRVAIARALVHRPKLVVCDEPTSALDHENGQRVMELLHSLAGEEGSTLVLVTHDSRIFHHADRIARMDDGRITTITAGASRPAERVLEEALA
ncbi:MAG: ABC transporter ATP-binding protein [Planctomycetes bacterium]|nr:ABC transporter ATP-binding protein [Planctomycetota bacterium]